MQDPSNLSNSKKPGRRIVRLIHRTDTMIVNVDAIDTEDNSSAGVDPLLEKTHSVCSEQSQELSEEEPDDNLDGENGLTEVGRAAAVCVTIRCVY